MIRTYDLLTGQITERELTQAELDAIASQPAPQGPAPLEQIRALEAKYADDQAKLTRQSLLSLALDKACADPAASALTREQVHEVLMSADNGYKALYELEQQVEALRAQL